MSKLIHSASLAGFKIAFPNWAYTDIDATNPNASYKSVAYTDDGYLYTHGLIFRIFPDAANVFASSRTGSVVTLKDTNSVTLTTFDVGVTSIVGTSPIVASTTAGVTTLTHASSSLSAGSIGATASSADSIVVPKITTDTYGHLITGSTQFTATLNLVKSSPITTNASYYLTFVNSNATQTSELSKSTGIYVNPSTNTLTVPTIILGAKTLDTTYAPILHNSTATTYGLGDATHYGHVMLNDSTADVTHDMTSGVAATPTAVSAALALAKTYAEGLFASNDAMIFKGTLAASTGVITSGDSNVNGKTLSQLTNYSAGWTFKSAGVVTIAGLGDLEAGDMIICVKDYATAYASADWQVIQSNVDGAVSAAAALTANSLIVGDGGVAGVKTLANGTSGYYLASTGATTVPSWTAAASILTNLGSTTSGSALTGNIGVTGILPGANGGTGVANTGKTITLGGNLTTSGAYTLTLTVGANTTVTLPTTGTLSTLEGSEALTNKTYNRLSLTANTAGFSIAGGTTSKTLTVNNTLGLSGTDGSTLNIGTGGTLGTGAYATAYVLPVASTGALGGIKLKSAAVTSPSYNSISTTAGKYYEVLMDTTGQNLFVNIPWADSNTVSALAVGATGTTTSAETTNGNTYLKLVNNGVLTNSFKIFGSGATSVISNASGNIEVNSVNSWRNVTAYLLSSNTSGLVLSNTINTADLDFGSEFLWDATGGSGNDGQLRIGWAEIADNGTITYAV